MTVDIKRSAKRSKIVNIHRTLLFSLWAVSLSAYANFTKPIDISSEFLRYRHAPEAMAVFGRDISDDPAIGAPARSALYFEQAKLSAKTKQYLSTIRNYTRALDIHPTAAAFNNRGLAHRQLGETDAAARDFTSALQLQHDDPHAWLNLGNLQFALKQYAVAIESFSHAINSGNQSANVYISRGNAYCGKGDAQNALLDYDAAIAQAPFDPRAHFGKAVAFYTMGNLDGAESEFNTALRLDPSDLNSMRGLAIALRDQHKYSESIEAYTSALKMQPGDALLFSGRAESYLEMGDLTHTISDYSQAIALQPSDDLLLRLRGLAYDHQGNYDNAIADFVEATRLAPSSARGYSLWAEALEHSHRSEESMEVLARAIRLMPADISLRHDLAVALEHRGDYASAIKEYQAILRISPTDIDNRIFLADDETTLGQYQDAAHDYEIANRAAPDKGQLLYGRAQLSFYTGDFRRAEADLERWQELQRKGKIDALAATSYYVAIWRHLVALRLNVDDRTVLEEGAAHLDAAVWPFPVLAFYMGKANAAMLQSAINRSSMQDREGQLCEADAYLGEWRLAQGDATGARQSFDAASVECPVNFIERAMVRRELVRMAEGVK
ncbi:tetratricopeptide repeat protein [Paraburkholderia fungorum]|uniref:tetratricopeptide repeat protein n=1 Tax=Paraburkholderia fungorum TaxID=134537 RepID=UPI0038BA827A